ncbi:P-loop containing nucleoside triphosphate hydrolase protein [Mycena albidolilacea]|uniref:P-loop containing nucleoside triphosphate hydrolase protein n=1 Tax=Mycena albidolilacea TaxID=1033008 RepID=A0AAD7EX93_9AGAR|nr:P-loop containing nucleoside triphosphate hydrolase protein [Mycena albidolilacea]
MDRRGAKRTVPMKVLVLGFCRTGTACDDAEALEALGYRETHHMQSILRNPAEVDMWREAIDAKFFGKGKPHAVTDLPAILFSEELIAAYPEAKVVLTNRDPAKWWKSYSGSLQTLYRWKRVRVAGWFDPWHFGKVIKFAFMAVTIVLGDAAARAEKEKSKARFVEHYENVRKIVPKERLLEYEVGEGWHRLCKFLGDKVPDTEFPRVNDTETLKRNIDISSWQSDRWCHSSVTFPS